MEQDKLFMVRFIDHPIINKSVLMYDSEIVSHILQFLGFINLVKLK